jgi:cytochrome c
MKTNRNPGLLFLILLVSILLGGACSGSTEPSGQGPATLSESSTPAEFSGGEALFTAHCARCHGMKGIGTHSGPPLVHKIYEPNHHGDPSFHRAVQMGVIAHHWSFGHMPRIENVAPEEVDAIIGYVRWLQRQAGIF